MGAGMHGIRLGKLGTRKRMTVMRGINLEIRGMWGIKVKMRGNQVRNCSFF